MNLFRSLRGTKKNKSGRTDRGEESVAQPRRLLVEEEFPQTHPRRLLEEPSLEADGVEPFAANAQIDSAYSAQDAQSLNEALSAQERPDFYAPNVGEIAAELAFAAPEHVADSEQEPEPHEPAPRRVALDDVSPDEPLSADELGAGSSKMARVSTEPDDESEVAEQEELAQTSDREKSSRGENKGTSRTKSGRFRWSRKGKTKTRSDLGKNVVEGSDGELYVVTESTLVHDLLILALKISVIILAFALLFTFIFGFNRVTSADMTPNVNDGDLIVFYQLDKNYQAGDLTLLTYDGKTQVRRVIATAGDTVNIDSDGLKINGALQQESKIHTDTTPYQSGIRFPVTVSEGEVFVLADNRVDATDSRVYGPIKIAQTKGKVMLQMRRRAF